MTPAPLAPDRGSHSAVTLSNPSVALAVPPELVEVIAERVVELLQERVPAAAEDRWLDTRDAATYLGLTPNALHKLTAARAVPFSQDVAGGKCWFLRSELDAWRRDGGPATVRRAA